MQYCLGHGYILDKGDLLIILILGFAITGLVISSYYAQDPQPNPKPDKIDKPHLVNELPGRNNSTLIVVPNPNINWGK